MDFASLHDLLRSTYDEMMPLCAQMSGIAKGIAGLGALFYIALRVWASIARAEPIDVFPLLRPFVLGFCIMFFPTVVLGTMNAVLSPVVQGTEAMVHQQENTLAQLVKRRDKLQEAAYLKKTDTAYWVSNEKFDEKIEEMAEVSDEFAAQNAAEEAERVEASRSRSKIERSMQRYAENNRLLNDFYTTDPSEKEREELRSQVAELKNELAKKNDKQENEEERQLALMEKSYQMAAKYLPKSTPNNPTALNNAFAQAQERTIVAPSSDKQSEGAKAVEVLPERKQVVSSLSGTMSDADFVKMYGTKGRNLAFHSMNNEKKSVERNTIRVQIDHTLVLKEGDDVVLRLLENARIGDLHLPRRSRIIASAKIEGHRMQLLVKSIEHAGRILPIKLSAYDMDGQEGVYIPELENLSALKEMGANIGGTMGTSFTFASSAKDQIISETARGVMQGASQLLQKKLRTIKVTIKGGYKLFLMPTK